ncbi:thioredoxin family protein [Indibacter alkaliphilus LW1]|uniref:Thioredoxin family protein n=1 Tax=Indibacter alkaliphilus (strain CCUG 57479 / KCTC 22604 / LW1) TaxID=1189612 RepID=S2D388_INDAL|nr:TlpA disulfide reductase family protein [Indibacter alkaliphilus]EOZ93772.1 thioredoxin family protein [Indibacter alkaliphilus LW1]
MAIYLKSCFLAFLCLYRSKSYGIRKKRIDRQKLGESLSYYPKSRWNPLSFIYSAVCNWLYPSDSCPAYVRLRALTALGSKYPRSLNAVHWLASLALTVRVTLDLIQENFFVASLRSTKVRTKGLAYSKHSLKDGSRYVCVPSYLKTKKPFLTVIFVLAIHLSGISQTKPVYIYGEIITDRPWEEISVTLHREYYGKLNSLGTNENFKIPVKETSFFHGTGPDTQLFYLELDLDKPAYLSLQDKRNNILDRYIILPGDSLYLQVDQMKMDRYYMGSHAKQFDVQHQIRQEVKRKNNLKPTGIVTYDKNTYLGDEKVLEEIKAAENHSPYKKFQITDFEDLSQYWKENLSQIDNQPPGLKILESYQGQIPDQLYRILEADILAGPYLSHYMRFHMHSGMFGKSPEMEKLYWKYIHELPELDISEEVKLSSADYQDMLVYHAKVASIYEEKEAFDILFERHSGELRNHLLINFFGLGFKHQKDIDFKLNKTLEHVTKPEHRVLLEELLLSNALGQELPELKMKSIDGETVALDEFKGKVLLLDFWFTGCQPCLMLYKTTLKPLKERLASIEDVEILSINVESSEERWKKSVSEGKYTSPEGHNFYIGKRTEHPFLKHYKVNGFPTLMVVDKDGKLYSFAGTPRDLDELERLLMEARNIN